MLKAESAVIHEMAMWRVPVFERMKMYDWTFSATAEIVVGVLLALAIVLSVFA